MDTCSKQKWKLKSMNGLRSDSLTLKIWIIDVNARITVIYLLSVARSRLTFSFVQIARCQHFGMKEISVSTITVKPSKHRTPAIDWRSFTEIKFARFVLYIYTLYNLCLSQCDKVFTVHLSNTRFKTIITVITRLKTIKRTNNVQWFQFFFAHGTGPCFGQRLKAKRNTLNPLKPCCIQNFSTVYSPRNNFSTIMDRNKNEDERLTVISVSFFWRKLITQTISTNNSNWNTSFNTFHQSSVTFW